MSGNRPVQCLLCVKKLVVKDLRDHIHKHLDYFPYKCNSCSYESENEANLEQHTLDHDHESTIAKEPYKEWLLKTIYSDILYAAKNGTEEMLDKKKGNAASAVATPIVSNLPSSSQSTPVTRRKEKQPEPPKSSTSSDDDDDKSSSFSDAPVSAFKQKRKEKEEIKKQARNLVATSSNKRQNSVKDDEEYDEDVQKLLAETSKLVQCMLCSAKISTGICYRQDHVEAKHMENVKRTNEEAYRQQLENHTKHAFPRMAYKSTQCTACKKEIGTQSGRNTHVVLHIFENYIACPMDPCMYNTRNLGEIHSHLVNTHGIQRGKSDLGGEKFAEFHKKHDIFKRKVEMMINLLFPLSFPDSKSKGKKRKEEDDEDPTGVRKEQETLFTLLKDIPKAPLPARPTPKRRKSPSSSDDSSDSDDEIKNPPKRKEQRVEKVDEKEESGGEEDKDDARSTVSSSRHSIASISVVSTHSNKSHKSEAKSEASSSVKSAEATKDEPPVTPQRKSIPLIYEGAPPAKWPGRELPMPQAGAKKYDFPSERVEAENRRRERMEKTGHPYPSRGGGRGGMHRGGFMRGGRGGLMPQGGSRGGYRGGHHPNQGRGYHQPSPSGHLPNQGRGYHHPGPGNSHQRF